MKKILLTLAVMATTGGVVLAQDADLPLAPGDTHIPKPFLFT